MSWDEQSLCGLICDRRNRDGGTVRIADRTLRQSDGNLDLSAYNVSQLKVLGCELPIGKDGELSITGVTRDRQTLGIKRSEYPDVQFERVRNGEGLEGRLSFSSGLGQVFLDGCSFGGKTICFELASPHARAVLHDVDCNVLEVHDGLNPSPKVQSLFEWRGGKVHHLNWSVAGLVGVALHWPLPDVGYISVSTRHWFDYFRGAFPMTPVIYCGAMHQF